MANKSYPRTHETRYWIDQRFSKPITSGFPKAEEGSIKGASNAVAKGYAHKVQRVERATQKVEWTVKRGDKVPGVNIRPVLVFRGDPDAKPVRRKEQKDA